MRALGCGNAWAALTRSRLLSSGSAPAVLSCSRDFFSSLRPLSTDGGSALASSPLRSSRAAPHVSLSMSRVPLLQCRRTGASVTRKRHHAKDNNAGKGKSRPMKTAVAAQPWAAQNDAAPEADDDNLPHAAREHLEVGEGDPAVSAQSSAATANEVEGNGNADTEAYITEEQELLSYNDVAATGGAAESDDAPLDNAAEETTAGEAAEDEASSESAPDAGWQHASTEATDVTESQYIADAFPAYAAEYVAAEVNTTPVREVLVSAAEVATWRCPKCSHDWRCAVFIRCVLKTGCPRCIAAHHPTLAAARPDLVQLWDAEENSPFDSPEEIPASSNHIVHWRCSTCHGSYTASVRDRVQDKVRCPSCALTRLQSADALAQDESALVQEWHPLKNGDLRLEDISPTDRKTMLWWLCAVCGHDWSASLATRLSRSGRTKGKTCPVCRGQSSIS